MLCVVTKTIIICFIILLLLAVHWYLLFLYWLSLLRIIIYNVIIVYLISHSLWHIQTILLNLLLLVLCRCGGLELHHGTHDNIMIVLGIVSVIILCEVVFKFIYLVVSANGLIAIILSTVIAVVIVARNKLILQICLLICILCISNRLVIIRVGILREILLHSKLRSGSTWRVRDASHLLKWIIQITIIIHICPSSGKLFLFICWALGCSLRNRLIHFLHKSVK